MQSIFTCTGNISLLKANISTVSVTNDRAKAMAFVTGGVAIGMAIGPGWNKEDD